MKTPPSDSLPPRAALIALYRRALVRNVRLDLLEEQVQEQLSLLELSRTRAEADLGADKKRQQKRTPVVIRIGAYLVPMMCIALGFYLLGSATLPIAWAYWEGRAEEVQLIAPIPSDQVLELTPIVVASGDEFNEPASESGRQLARPKVLDVKLDYTNLANWFPANLALPEMSPGEPATKAVTYTLDIPKLELNNAQVVAGGTDLNKSLIAFPGTAAPGEYGAPVIFGHSVLRQFYNPSEKNSRRYTSIFSTIMTLKKGDEIFVTADGVRYTYVVQDKIEVKPTDVYILNQSYDARRLKLVTCTPEGTYLRRGVITAELINKTEVGI